MKRSTLASSVAACFCLGLGLATPVLAAQPAATPPAPNTAQAPASAAMGQHSAQPHTPSAGATSASDTKGAGTCLSDLGAFDSEMEKSGYWVGGGDRYGYGSPVYGYNGPPGGRREASAARYRNVRPGYEIRTLVASANILARNGQQQACEAVLAATRSVFKIYVGELLSGRVPKVNSSLWRKQQIAAARPVASKTTAFRYNELIGTEVRDPQNKGLGSVDDLVMDPQTGKIAYLIIGRGGVFGIGEGYVPVPWDDFRSTPSLNLLVLDTTNAAMSAAPQAKNDQFKGTGQFDQESQKVNAYWKMHFSSKSESPSEG